MSAPSTAVRRVVYERDEYRCAACRTSDGLTFQHRRATGMGGTKNLPSPVDGLTLCAVCNEGCEAAMQELALAYGWKARRWTDPAMVPVFYRAEYRWYRLDSVDRHPINAGVALDMMFAVYGDEYAAWRDLADGTAWSSILRTRGI